MITLKIACNTGRQWIANFSGTCDNAESYFPNKTARTSDVDIARADDRSSSGRSDTVPHVRY